MGRRTVTAAVVLAGISAATLFLVRRIQTRSQGEPSPASSPDLTLHPLYRTYDFGKAGPVLRVGVQPLYYPTGLILETIRRDGVLREELQALGLRLELFSFYKGDDVNHFLLRGDLDAGVGGDMPALGAAASGGVTITSVLHRGYTSVLSRRSRFVADLKGQRIAYALGSNAHYALMKALADEGLSESDVDLIPMEVTQMPAALQSGRIQAFSAWEPTVETALMMSPGTIVTSRTMSTGFLYFSDRIVEERPAAVRLLLAAQVRATRWMVRSRDNLRRATEWSIQAAERFSGESFPLSPARAMDVAEKELLGVRSTPVPSGADLESSGRLAIEFRFLKERSWIETDLTWDGILAAFDMDMITEVIRRPDLYRLEEYRYLDESPMGDPEELRDNG